MNQLPRNQQGNHAHVWDARQSWETFREAINIQQSTVGILKAQEEHVFFLGFLVGKTRIKKYSSIKESIHQAYFHQLRVNFSGSEY